MVVVWDAGIPRLTRRNSTRPIVKVGFGFLLSVDSLNNSYEVYFTQLGRIHRYSFVRLCFSLDLQKHVFRVIRSYLISTCAICLIVISYKGPTISYSGKGNAIPKDTLKTYPQVQKTL